MGDYTIAALKAAILGAGGSGPNVDVAASVSLAENTGMSLTAASPNPDGSIDRGPWQINNRWHPEVSDSCAYDLACSTAAAARISNGFTNFSAWTTFTRGLHLAFLPKVQGTAADAAGAGASLGGLSIPGLSGLVGGIRRIALEGVLVAGGIALVALGGWRSVAPTVRRVQGDAATAAKIAAVAA